ncbi:nicotinate-nucleotide adenylyltransferase [Maridesulfovibrio ferrireducens]|uniref:Probable nicotinate-nucleotide adenylyltransferase n=1 Tax=Maridesulfovibrio ferrireducens TaxID=246191 RepID=A0A1G9EEJ5_9BACT|nr:nicotinate-nucleotide adenylyltransferase [Maridesulfovibrio ferrireducens]SDK74536.1 nicotinate-nucleotide adenylyltransferase [Maridesulfovibrio ferrireducens]
MKIGLFGGSFNPVHNTHIDVASAVMKRLGLDQVLFVPAGNPYHKKCGTMLPAELRFELIQRAVDGLDNFDVCDIDMSSTGPTYTVQTLKEALKRYPEDELYFLMGQDAFNSLPGWKDWEKIPLLANIVAVSRGKSDAGEMTLLLKKIFTDIDNTDTNEWKLKDGKSVYIIDDFDFKISSTFVRKVWREGGDISLYVPAAVADYVKGKADEFNKYWGLEEYS